MYDTTTAETGYDVHKAYLGSKRLFDERLSLAISRKLDRSMSDSVGKQGLAGEVHQCLDDVAQAYGQMEPLARILARDSQHGLNPRRGYMWEVTQRRMQFVKLAADVGYRNQMFL